VAHRSREDSVAHRSREDSEDRVHTSWIEQSQDQRGFTILVTRRTALLDFLLCRILLDLGAGLPQAIAGEEPLNRSTLVMCGST
jgi:hypothetical protein